MKKQILYGLILIMILATLACRLPFFSQPLATPAVTAEETISEEATLLPQQPTIAMTETPEATATPTTADITGAARVYSDSGFEITLPNTYILGDVDKDLAVLMEGLQALGEEEAGGIQALYEQNKEDIVLWGYDTESPAQHMTSMLVLKNEEFAGMSLSIISVFANALLGDEVDSLSQERLTFGDRDVLRFLTTAQNAGVETAQAVYLFKEAGKLWVVGFFTNQSQIDQRLPTFDAAVASFAIVTEE